jgi:hypothetical protein
MEKRPLIQASLLLHAIRTATHKVTMAMIHPQDAEQFNLAHLRALIGGVDILPSDSVERGMLYVSTKEIR